MKAVIFAGGAGTRLWPLSRKQSPKQFEKVIGDKSTLELAIERLLPDFDWQDIYIATSEKYISLVKNKIPNILGSNIIGEPDLRDVGPAVGLTTAVLLKKNANTPVIILWSDHIVKEDVLFRNILKTCAKIISTHKDKILFISQKARFASQNLGWIKFGNARAVKDGIKLYEFESFYYRPSLSLAEKFYQDGHYAWNVGYFVTTPSFLWSLFKKYQPEMFKLLKQIYDTVDTSRFKLMVKEIYPKLPKISFDNAILEKISKEEALVVSEDLGWSDVGAWEALKEALQSSPEQNVIQGKVLVQDCHDTLVYNYTDQMVVTIDLNGFMVVNTNDVVLVCHKNSVPKIKKLVEHLAQSKNHHLV